MLQNSPNNASNLPYIWMIITMYQKLFVTIGKKLIHMILSLLVSERITIMFELKTSPNLCPLNLHQFNSIAFAYS